MCAISRSSFYMCLPWAQAVSPLTKLRVNLGQGPGAFSTPVKLDIHSGHGTWIVLKMPAIKVISEWLNEILSLRLEHKWKKHWKEIVYYVDNL